MSFRKMLFGVFVFYSAYSVIAEENQIQTIPLKPDPPISIDAAFGDWQSVPGAGPEESGIRIQTAWRQEALFIAVESKGKPCEIVVTIRPPDTERTYSFLLDPVSNPPKAVQTSPENNPEPGVVLAAAVTETAWILEAALPFSLAGMLSPVQGMSFLLAIHPAGDDGVFRQALLCGTDGKPGKTPPVATVFTECRLEPGTHSEFSLDAPTRPEGLLAVFSVLARLDFKQVAGYSPALRVLINGKAAGGERMLNRPLRMKARGGDLYSMAAGELLSTYYSPDYTSPDTDSHYGPVDPIHVCVIELDVTDLIVEGANTVTVEHAAPSNTCALALADGQLLFMPPPPPPKPKAGPPTGALPFIAPAAETAEFQATSETDGVIKISVGGESFSVTSRFSTPEPAWVSGGNAWFSHQRTTENTGDAVIVRDTFTNLTSENLPVMRRNEISMGDSIKHLWLAGLERADKAGFSASPANPTTYAATESVGIGLLPLDDVARIHAANHAQDGIVGLSDNNLILQPGVIYMAEWAIVPTATPDYWAFINAARRLYNANFTIEGAFVFLRADPHTDAWTDEQTADFLLFKSADYVCASISYPMYKGRYPHGTAFQLITHDNFINSFNRWKSLMPDIRTQVYFHCFIDVTDDGPERFADARLILPDGSHANYGEAHDRIYIPTSENSYGVEVGKNVDVILEKIGADGVYWDEHEYSRHLYHYAEPWDGVTGDIDQKSMTISRLKSSVTLLSEPWRLEMARRILARGPLVGNGPPFTRAMAALQFPCFVETGSISHCTQAHLHTPIALGDHLTERSELDAYRVMQAALDYGCVYHWYNDLTVIPAHPHLVRYMYPITPVEIHAGYVIGKERILTKVSGMFGWGDVSEHEVHVFNDLGIEVEDFAAPLIQEDGKTWTELRLAENWSATIVRK
jgi:hypothetical protein